MIKIKRILESTNDENVFNVVGEFLRVKENDVTYTLVSNDVDEAYPYLVEGADGTILRFNKEGESEIGGLHLTEVSKMRLLTSSVVFEKEWTEVELKEDFSDFKETLTKFGYMEKPIFLSITDAISETTEPVFPEMRDTHEVKTRWIIRLESLTLEESDVDGMTMIPCEHIIAISDYIEKSTKKIAKRTIFISFPDPDEGTRPYSGLEQIRSIQPADDNDITLWEEASKSEYRDKEFIPLLVKPGERGFQLDPDLKSLEDLLKAELGDEENTPVGKPSNP